MDDKPIPFWKAIRTLTEQCHTPAEIEMLKRNLEKSVLYLRPYTHRLPRKTV